MSDIVEYLRTFEGSDDLGNGNFSRLHEIADEITCLRAELETATHRAARAAQSEIGRQARELSIQIIEANAEIIKLRAELAKYKWRPIAEAPKDEQVLFGKFVPKEHPYWMASGEIDADGILWCDYTDAHFSVEENFQKPTHFMRLPAPPEVD